MNDDCLEDLTVLVFNEALRLLQMCNRKASLAQMHAICTAGPEGALLKSCLAYVEREWPGETHAAGFFRDLHALPPDELVALRLHMGRYCRGSVTVLWKPEDFDESPADNFNGAN